MPRLPTTNNSTDEPLDYESTLLHPATAADLDLEAVRVYLAALDAEAGRAPFGGDAAGDAGNAELLRRLSALGLARGADAEWRPTVAGLLLFGRAPHHFLPQVQIKAARFRGGDVTGLIVDRAELTGAVAPIIDSVTQFVARNMHVSGVIEGIYRRDLPEYPIQAVREAVTNAVAHRDYSLAGQK